MLKKTLHTYWGYSSFREKQEDIVQSVIDGNDTLALLPTGGGKSICYQLPALILEGVCLVVSPLVALMRDQVEQLKSRGVSATYIHSGLSRREMHIEYESIRNERYKLVYVSPERLRNPDFQNSLEQTRISFLAVDEAHCISQWGHDFRPVYRQIAEIRELKPDLKILALTASATVKVKEDIINQLELTEVKVFEMGFFRENLNYLIRYEEDKRRTLIQVANKVGGTGIIYVRNRRKTVELSNFLRNNNISADYYHAGLSPSIRNVKQDSWTKGDTQLMISTNAFGMGIDKADVRFVIHYDLPDSIESYYQEAGRAGRDEAKAWCVLLYNEADIITGKSKIHNRFPVLERVNKIYENLCNYFELAFHTGEDARFDFDLEDFCKKFENPALETFSAIKILEQLEYIMLSDGLQSPSKVKVEVSSTELYGFQLKNKKFDPLIKMILRSYSGVFDHFVDIREEAMAKRLKIGGGQISSMLKTLKQLKLIDYHERTDLPYITYLQPRVNEIVDSENWLDANRKRTLERFDSLVTYLESENCRSKEISKYFGEVLEKDCGNCDVCRLKRRYAFSSKIFGQIETDLMKALSAPRNLEELMKAMEGFEPRDVQDVIRWLLDDGILEMNTLKQIEKVS